MILVFDSYAQNSTFLSQLKFLKKDPNFPQNFPKK